MGETARKTGSFGPLSPEAVSLSVEAVLGEGTDGTLVSYPSYINRVYGLRLEPGRDEVQGRELIAKFYRPGRWTRAAILDEHRFLMDCAEAEIPVASPMRLPDGGTLGEALVEDDEGAEHPFSFALFPKKGGRNFDAEGDEDWLRLGSLIGRFHRVGSSRRARHRSVCTPVDLSLPFVEELLEAGLVHPEFSAEFSELCRRTLARIAPLFEGVSLGRIHGDCHRGNILDRRDEGLLVIDFDDMMVGPAVQDLWLLLPDHAESCRRQLGLIVEGYEDFMEFDRRELALIEPLRFMRMVYFLAWRSRQREDLWFRESFPDWGGKDFWRLEIGDLRDQAELVEASLASGGWRTRLGDNEKAEGPAGGRLRRALAAGRDEAMAPQVGAFLFPGR
ncbi:MAG TPA: serine/threonine protein kinase [Rectinemataceae bacterium]|nr:serine/threonine protein kinase [Rectinemataceae bacterium]